MAATDGRFRGIEGGAPGPLHPPLQCSAIAYEGWQKPGHASAQGVSCLRGAVHSRQERAGTKYNRSAMGNATGITMQGLATAREKPRCQEQWRAMEKTMHRAMKTVGNSAAC